MGQCDVRQCNDSASARVHRAGLNDALHLPQHLPPRATHKTNRFDDERRLEVPPCPQSTRSKANRREGRGGKR